MISSAGGEGLSISLYRRYRPQTFAEVVGQDAAVEVLLHALSSSRVGHAYLFSGPRGCGKTSAARILAKALDCASPNGQEPCGACPSCLAIAAGESLDVVEIDGASNNGVDDIRELKEHVELAPFSSKHKVYIIDEVHMLSSGAFNALLKTLEEPPSYVVFILATTEPHKVPVTIRSRCQHIPFRSIAAGKIFEQLQKVCGLEGISAQPEALWELARQADGAMRDALSMLEQLIASAAGDVRLQDVEATLGAGSRPALERWIVALRQGDGSPYVGLKEMMDRSASPQRLFEKLFSPVRDLWLATRWPGVVDALDVSEQERAFIREEASKWRGEDLRSMLSSLVELIAQARMGVRADVLLGIFMLDLTARAEPRAPAPALDLPVPPPPASEPLAPPHAPDAPTRPSAPQPISPPPSAPPSAPIEPSTSPAKGPASPSIDSVPWAPLSPDERDALLSSAHDADFVLWCALLDATPQRAEGRLLLDMGDRYCYETLRLERNASKLMRAFPGSPDGIFLRHGDDVSSCPMRGREGIEEDEAPKARRAARATKEKEATPPPQGGRDAPSDVDETDAGATSADAASFEGRMRKLAHVLGGEIVLIRREADSASDDEPDADDGDGEGDEG